MSKCIKCSKEAEFVSPDNLCVFHWSEWWTDGVMDGEETVGGYTREEILKETLDIAQNGYNPDEEEEAEEK